jgi:hypothetical protein
MSNISAQDRLDDISPIKTIHAVNSNVANLFVEDLASCLVNFVSMIETEINLGHEIIESVKFVLNFIN